jgi:hypothetical protein
MYFVRGCPAPAAGVVPLVVSFLPEFPLLKLEHGCAPVNCSFCFSADGLELIWKDDLGARDYIHIRRLTGVCLVLPASHGQPMPSSLLHQSSFSFRLMFGRRSIALAARSEHDRCMFLSGLLCLLDHAEGCSAGREIWDDVAPLLIQTCASAKQQPISAYSINQSQEYCSSKLSSAMSINSEQLPEVTGALVREMVMQKRIACAASEDFVSNCRVQLFDDGTVVVLRDVSSNSNQELMRSSFFSLSPKGIDSHVWMSQVHSNSFRRRCICP